MKLLNNWKNDVKNYLAHLSNKEVSEMIESETVKLEEIETADGTKLKIDGDVSVGAMVEQEVENPETGEMEYITALPNTYELEDGTKIVVSEDGVISEIIPAETESETESEEQELEEEPTEEPTEEVVEEPSEEPTEQEYVTKAEFDELKQMIKDLMAENLEEEVTEEEVEELEEEEPTEETEEVELSEEPELNLAPKKKIETSKGYRRRDPFVEKILTKIKNKNKK